jgi:SAM-dependent methyltransferase
MTNLAERVACPSCGHAPATSLMRCRFLDRPVLDFLEAKFPGRPFAERLGQAHYELLECHSCGLMYQRAVPDGEFLHEFYDDWLNADDGIELGGRSVELDRAVGMASEVATIVHLLRRSPKDVALLDFGMGWGRWAAMAGALGCQSTGWDLSPQRRCHARKLGVNVPEAEAALRVLRFDAINSEQVLEHVVSPADVLRELVPLLRPGGIVRLGVPDGRHVRTGLPRIRWGALKRDRHFMQHLMPITPLIHINTFTAVSLAHLGRSVGLEPVHPPLGAAWSVLPASGPRAFVRALARPLHRRLVPTTWLHFRLRTTRAG